MRSVLVYTKYGNDLPRFRELLESALPGAEVHFADSPNEAEPHLADTEILYGWGFDATLLKRMPSLRWVQKMGAGVDDILRDWPCGPNVILTRTDGRLIAARMVEYVIGAILDRTACFDVARRQQTARLWRYLEIGSIADMVIGVAGLGEIGSEVARSLAGLGANVIGWRRSATNSPWVSQLYIGNDELGNFARRCDVIVLILPMTHATAGLFDARVLDLSRPGAHIINIGRGGVLDERALLNVLDSKQVSHATLDVFAVEPLPRDHPFWSHPQITITPHVCGPLIPEKIVPHFLQNYASFVSGEPMKHVIDIRRQY